MQSYIVNNLTIKAEQMTEPFELTDENGSFKGEVGDYIIHENGLQRGCKKAVFEKQYTKTDDKEAARERFRRLMEQGYQEMAEINLQIANEMSHLENEANKTVEDSLKNI